MQLRGISLAWFDEAFPGASESTDPAARPKLRLDIPAQLGGKKVVGFRQDAFGSYTAGKDVANPSKYRLVSVDASRAVSLVALGSPDDVQSGSQVFMGQDELVEVIGLPESLKFINKSAFRYCSALKRVDVPQSLERLGSSAFSGARSLEHLAPAASIDPIVFPDGLLSIGKQCFEGAFAASVSCDVVIPASVETIESEAFYSDKGGALDYVPINTIIIERDATTGASLEGYNGSAFKCNGSNYYGPGKRMVLFPNMETRKAFKPSGFQVYSDACTYEIPFSFIAPDGSVVETQPKLYRQAVNATKSAGGWIIDADYSLPVMPDDLPVKPDPGYEFGWEYKGKPMTSSTKLADMVAEDSAGAGQILKEPEIHYVGDGVLAADGVANMEVVVPDDGASVGVRAEHALADRDLDERGYVYFKYRWTDVKDSGQGPRNDDPGFGWPEESETIEIRDAADARYGSGDYYLVEIYGYYHENGSSGQSDRLFYKSHTTIIGGSDPSATTNTSYTLKVKTSPAAAAPKIDLPSEVVLEFSEQADIDAVVTPAEGCEVTSMQWYRADGSPVEGATGPTLSLDGTLPLGEHGYRLVVDVVKLDNGDSAQVQADVMVSVVPRPVTLTPEACWKYFGQEDPQLRYSVDEDPEKIGLAGELTRVEGEQAGRYEYSLDRMRVSEGYELVMAEDAAVFEIRPYEIDALIECADGQREDGTYRGPVVIKVPEGHVVSIDGGKTWSDRVALSEHEGELEYILRSELEDETRGALDIDTAMITIRIDKPINPGDQGDGQDDGAAAKLPGTGDASGAFMLCSSLLAMAGIASVHRGYRRNR
ncbi:MAG: leucine-rich repeat domain-containing protein [Collinsella sp.]|nr:leucine-rich repeat domain-containing protein [Collinsella sp.]